MKSQKKKYATSFALGFAIFCIISALISLILIIPMLDFDFPLPSNSVVLIAISPSYLMQVMAVRTVVRRATDLVKRI